MLCCWIEDPNSEAFKLHIPRIFYYLWIAEDGMKMQVRSLSSLSRCAISILLEIIEFYYLSVYCRVLMELNYGILVLLFKQLFQQT